MDEYDVAIMGAGPAGLSAAIYSARYKLKTIVFGELLGGTISEAHLVWNYPGFEEISGIELGMKMLNHAKNLGVKIEGKRIDSITKKQNLFELSSGKEKFFAKKVIIAIGTKRKKLGIKGEEQFLGKGVTYCATCDGAFFGDKIVGVVGGGNSAIDSALLLSDIAKKVFVIYKRKNFVRVEPTKVDLLAKRKNVEFIFKATPTEIYGTQFVEGIKLDNGKDLKLDGLFIEIGAEPVKEFLHDVGVETDEKGYIIVDTGMKTNITGIFAAGDITSTGFRQAIVAAGQGAVAALSAYKEISEEK